MRRHSFIPALTAACVLGASGTALALDRTVVTDHGGEELRNSFGNCVLTKWVVDRNICNPPPAPMQQAKYTPPPQVTFSEDDRTVFFEFDSAELSPSTQNQLDMLASKVKTSGQVYDGLIVGFADRIGSSSYNQRLSQSRADKVAEYLRGRGLAISGVEIRHKGESDSTTSCSDSMTREALISCLSRDRRVEVELKLREAARS